MPSPSALALNYKTVFHNVGRRFVNLDSLPCYFGSDGLTVVQFPCLDFSAMAHRIGNGRRSQNTDPGFRSVCR